MTSMPGATTDGAVRVTGGDAAERARVAALLSGAGAAARTEVGPLAAVRVLLTGDDPVEDVRAAVAEDPGERVVAVVSAERSFAVLRRVLVAGAAGIVRAADLDAALAPTCGAVAAGQLAVPAPLVRQIAPRPLSHREKQVLGLVVEGCTNREIAARLFLAESTVKTHVASVFAKLDAHSRADVVARVLDPDSGYEPSMVLAPVTRG